MCDYQPIIAAIAIGVPSIIAACVALIMSVAHGRSISANSEAISGVQTQVNGARTELINRVAQLEAAIRAEGQTVPPPATTAP